MATGEALELALALHGQPARAAEARSRPLPGGVTEVLRLASGNAQALAAAVDRTGAASATLIEASRFFVEQQLLARECENDPWRVLGVLPSSNPELIRDHRRLLLGLVHPDRGEDWAAAFSDRVNRAWRELKTPEGRSSASRLAREAPGNGEPEPGQTSSQSARSDLGDDAWDPVVSQEVTRVEWQSAPDRQSAQAPVAPVHYSVRIAFIALLVSGLTLLGWNLTGNNGIGDEVLVPMISADKDQAAPRSAQRPLSPAPQVLAEAGDVVSGIDLEVGATDRLDSPGQSVGPEGIASQADPTGTLVVTSGPSSSSRSVETRDAEPDSPDRAAASARPSPIPLAAKRDGAGDPPRSMALPARAPKSPASDAAASKSPEVSPDMGEVKVAQAPLPAGDAVIEEGASESVAKPIRATASADQASPAGGLMVPDMEAPPALEPSAARGIGSELADETHALAGFEQLVVDKALGAGVLADFSRHYASGDLSSLIALFSPKANSARGGSMALAADYARLFEATSEREFAVSDVNWRLDGDTLRGEGRFEASYYRKGRFFRQVVKGQISCVMVQEQGATRILRLDSRPDGGGA